MVESMVEMKADHLVLLVYLRADKKVPSRVEMRVVWMVVTRVEMMAALMAA
jgi:hypothetical protein